MTMPTSQCPWRMQVLLFQETPDVWTLSLLRLTIIRLRGQYALVSARA